MGAAYDLYCHKCGYKAHLWLGVGFAYPMVFAEMQIKAKNGDLGDVLKDFFAEHPDGVIDPVPVIAQCENCGDYASIKANHQPPFQMGV